MENGNGNGNTYFVWGTAASWVALTSYYLSTVKMNLTVRDLVLMMPQFCEMTDLVGTGYVTFSPETLIKFCFCFTLLYFTCWWMTAEEVVGDSDIEVTKLRNHVDKQLRDEKEADQALMESSVSLVNNIDLEYEHCAALIGANNETPGQRVGGEVEWATGETSSEDEDATREVIGAHIEPKTPSRTEDEKILRCLTYPHSDFDDSISKQSGREPHLMCDLTESECGRSDFWSFQG